MLLTSQFPSGVDINAKILGELSSKLEGVEQKYYIFLILHRWRVGMYSFHVIVAPARLACPHLSFEMWISTKRVAPQLLTTSNFIGPWYHAALLFSGLGSIILLFGVLFSQQIREDLVTSFQSAQESLAATTLHARDMLLAWSTIVERKDWLLLVSQKSQANFKRKIREI